MRVDAKLLLKGPKIVKASSVIATPGILSPIGCISVGASGPRSKAYSSLQFEILQMNQRIVSS